MRGIRWRLAQRCNRHDDCSYSVGAVVFARRVCGIESGQHVRGVNRRVAHCRRNARMTQQLLDGAQIGAGREQMGGETVPQGVRCRSERKAPLPGRGGGQSVGPRLRPLVT